MSLQTTYIARASDGLILCESFESITDSAIEKLKQDGRELLRNLASPAHNNVSDKV